MKKLYFLLFITALGFSQSTSYENIDLLVGKNVNIIDIPSYKDSGYPNFFTKPDLAEPNVLNASYNAFAGQEFKFVSFKKGMGADKSITIIQLYNKDFGNIFYKYKGASDLNWIFETTAEIAIKNSIPKFEFSKKGFTDYVVVNVEGKSAKELYNKTIEWINRTYKNPREVIKAQIENDYIRFEGSEESALPFYFLGAKRYDVKYQIEVSVKDGKYKFDVIELSYLLPGYQSRLSSWIVFNLTSTSQYYKPSGEIKNDYKGVPNALWYLFNGLNLQLESFLTDDKKSKKDDW